LCPSLLMAQGTIRGKVTDFESGETLIGASVVLAGTATGAAADLDGNFSIENVPAGNYDLVCSFISYAPDTIKGVEVKDGEVTIQNFSMGSASVVMDVFTLEAKQSRATENYMIQMQKKSATVMDGISSAQIAKQGDNTAAGAVKRVTGVSLEGGKYVYVRGLSDRYSKTLLNGAEIPGLDPNRNSVQLDLFPTTLIENISVVKSFSPDLPASFTGGLINIETKDFPEAFNFVFSTSQGYNTNASFNNNFLTYDGGSTDFLGFDDGTRAIPSAVAGQNVPNPTEDPSTLTNMSRSFNNSWENTTKSALHNQSYAIGVGNQTKLFKKSFGYNVGLTYRNTNTFYEDMATNRYSLVTNFDEALELTQQTDFTDSRGENSVIWGALLNGSYKLNSNNKIGLVFMRNQNGISSSRYQEGLRPSDNLDAIVQTRSLRYLERSMSATQLKGEHFIDSIGGLKKVTIDWIGSYTLSQQSTPDLRLFTNEFEDFGDETDYFINPAQYPDPARFYREMEEYNIDGKLNIKVPFQFRKNESSFKIGGSYVLKHREFSENWYEFNSIGITYDGNVEDYFNPENMDASEAAFLYVNDQSRARNSYVADDNNIATYAMVDLKVNTRLRILTGARLETTNISLVSDEYDLLGEVIAETTDAEAIAQLTEARELFKAELNYLDVLPAFNSTYALNEEMNLRFGYSRTIARPAFREIAPFASFDFDYQFVKVGNVNIERTLVDNLDLRWEWYPELGELISFSVFYKRFDNPIELVINPTAANTELTWKNQDFANLYGTEMEVRKNLGFISSAVKNFNLGFNLTLVQSETKIDTAELAEIRSLDPDAEDTRVMFGQSPYIFNTFLGYRNDSMGLEANLSFNVSGRKMVLVTRNATPDVFELPVPNLDFNVKKQIKDRWTMTFAIRNILNPTVKRAYPFKGREDKYLFQSYNRGQTISLGIKYLIN